MGNEADAGQVSQCPTCGESFLIPNPVTPPQPDYVEPTIQDQEVIGHPEVAEEPAIQISVDGVPAPAVEEVINHEPELLHIACPEGHELEVPRDMLDQDALCPHCDVQFRLREVDSVEYQRKKQVERETRERRMENAWLNWTIALAIVVVLFFLSLWLMTSLRGKTASGTSGREEFLARHCDHTHPSHLHRDDWLHRRGKALPPGNDDLPSLRRDA